MTLLRFLASTGLLFLGACSCSQGDAPEPEFNGPELDLLGRRPDQVIEMPGAVTPRGDVPGMATFGESEGPGWSQTDHRLEDGTPYRTTNQARAELILPATRPAARELVMTLWCAHAVGATPARVNLELNGVSLVHGGVVLEQRALAEVRVPTPAEAWRRGTNSLEFSVEPMERGKERVWDTLALARLDYGPEARVLDRAQGGVHLADGAGVRYALELSGPARLELRGTTTGAGTLLVRSGSMDPRTSTIEMETGSTDFTADGAGALSAQMTLPHRAGAVRLVELEWSAGAASELALSELRVREQTPRARPPIVFVSIDTFAARHLALYGYPRETSPELARFQRDAVLFERCLTNAPWTLPSYLSVMSGLYPRSHTVTLDFQPGAEIVPHDLWQLADNRWTLAEALRARGYRTGAFIDTQWLSPIFRVDQGFDTYNGEGALARFEDPHAHIEHIVERLVPPWLAAGDAVLHPPFLFVHALDAHGPYLPDAPFRDTFLDTLEEARTHVQAGSDNQTYGAMPWWMSRTLQPDERVAEAPTVPLEDVVARYDESLLKVDAFIGKLFAQLRERGLYDEAVIVVSGDHGEFFGPGAYGHGLMQEAVLHVPLLVKLPGNAHAGERVSTPVALVDVYPTLLELAGVPPQPSRLHGTSLLATLSASTPAPERALYSEGGHVEQYALTLGCWRLVEEFPGSESSDAALLTHPRVPRDWLEAHYPVLLTQPLSKTLLNELQAHADYATCIRELRALLSGPYYALFDLCHDPEQRRDLAADEPAELARLAKALELEKQRSREAQRDARVSGNRESLSPEALRQLEQLGYGGGAPEDER